MVAHGIEEVDGPHADTHVPLILSGGRGGGGGGGGERVTEGGREEGRERGEGGLNQKIWPHHAKGSGTMYMCSLSPHISLLHTLALTLIPPQLSLLTPSERRERVTEGGREEGRERGEGGLNQKIWPHHAKGSGTMYMCSLSPHISLLHTLALTLIPPQLSLLTPSPAGPSARSPGVSSQRLWWYWRWPDDSCSPEPGTCVMSSLHHTL